MRRHHDIDALGAQIVDWVARARSMPPSWASHNDKVWIRGPEGERVGALLPGFGIELDMDLASVGITRAIDGVLERSAVMRWGEQLRRTFTRLLGDERGAITTYDALFAALGAGADFVPASKASFTSVGNTWLTTFRATGIPTVGTYSAIPTGTTLNRANVGALSLGMTSPTGGNSKYLYSLGFGSSSQLNMAMVVDQLWAGSTISANLNTAQTVSSAALTRYTTGAGVMVAFDVTTPLGATPSNITISYTNQAGTSGQTSTSAALTASAIAQRIQPSAQMPVLPLASGDSGVRAIASVTLSAAMGSGVLAALLYKPLIMLPGVAANIFISPDLASSIDMFTPLPVGSDSEIGCLALWVFPNSTTTGDTTVLLKAVSG